ncbi:MAG: glycosyltransferase [Sphaerochaetaceae bacterium]|nr:glycosyltransferase [Sphaerochaetaceae bacterium]
MSDLVSVIVPAFNVEKYIEKCVLSIKNQTYKDIEIILVDDGSKDRTGEICDSLSLKYPRIIVAHKQNGGLAGARNTGLKMASGRYVCFVDSDDFVEPFYVERLYASIKKNDSDIAFCGYDRVDESYRRIEDAAFSEGEKTMSREDLLRKISSGWTFGIVVWNKMYDRNILEGFSFSTVGKYEDLASIYKIYDRAQKASFVKDICYHYLVRSGSIMKTGTDLENLNNINVIIDRAKYFHDRGMEQNAVISLADACSCLHSQWFECDRTRELREEIKSLYKSYRKDGVPVKFLWSVRIFTHSIALFSIIKKVWNR